MKKTLLIVLISSVCCLLKAQSWVSLGKGIKNGGYYTPVSSLVVYNGELYAGGFFDSAGGVSSNFIARWNGTSWDSLNSKIEIAFPGGGTGLPNPVYALSTYTNNLYVGGTIAGVEDSIGSSGILSWNGTSWDSLAQGLSFMATVYAFTEYNGNLIVGGNFGGAGGNPANSIAQWNGTSWNSLGSGINGYNEFKYVYTFAVYNGNLYAGGYFDSAGGKFAKNIAMWNGTSWSPVGNGINNNGVFALIVYDGKLYAGGGFDSAGGIPANNIAVWNDTSWSAVGQGIKAVNGGVAAFTLFNGNLIAGGYFDTAGGIYANNIAQWNGTSWASFGSRMNKKSYVGVTALATYNGNLIVGGYFDSINGVNYNNIAAWCPGNCQPDSNKVSVNYSYVVYPNPNNGTFTIELGTVKGATEVDIYNSIGKKIYGGSLNPTTTMIDLSSDANGLYLYRMTTVTGKLVGEGKFIKQ